MKRFSGQLKASGSTVELNLIAPVIGCWDRHRIEQVIVNLISNAIKYAPRSPIHISADTNGEIAWLVVQDFGSGIPKDLQPKIFDRFERAGASKNVGGLGLGLFIVKKIVDAHHGKIRVESGEQKGTKFIVELPLKPSLSTSHNSDEGTHNGL